MYIRYGPKNLKYGIKYGKCVRDNLIQRIHDYCHIREYPCEIQEGFLKNSMKKGGLINICRSFGMHVTGTKEELAMRILAYYQREYFVFWGYFWWRVAYSLRMAAMQIFWMTIK